MSYRTPTRSEGMRLTHCARCRTTAPPDAPCAHCGSYTRTPAPVHEADALPSMRPARPLGVSIIAGVSVLAGIGGLVGAIAVGIGALPASDGTGWGAVVAQMLGPALPAITGAFALANVAAGVGLWRGVRWAWTLELALLAVGMLEAIARLVYREGSAVLSLALAGIVLAYLVQPDVKRWFGIGSTPTSAQ